MKQMGYVTEVGNNKVKVRVVRESSCGGNCASCKGCSSGELVIECEAEDNVHIGDRVILTMPSKTFFNGIFWGYAQVIIMMVAGAILGYRIFESEISSVFGMLAGTAVGLCISKAFSVKSSLTIKAKKADENSIC